MGSHCEGCACELPPRRRVCENCQRERKRKADRDRYWSDPAARKRQLEKRHERYDANLERERERSRRYYAQNREVRLAAANARNKALREARK